MPGVPILLGAPGLPGEPELVAELTRPGAPVTIVRRCVDAVDLLGAAAGGRARVAVVGAALPRLARDTVARLGAADVRVVGIATLGDDAGWRRLRDLDLPVVSVFAEDLGAAARDLARAIEDPHTVIPDASVVDEAESSPGRLIAVWGPHGAPGRTSVAIALADEVSRAGTASLLVDADTYGGSIATQLGLLEEAAGIVVACRQADGGRLDAQALAATARTISGSWRVLTGIPRAERWAEMRPSSLARLWETCRSTPGITVADVGFSLEADEEYLLDTRAPRRNAATLSALSAADAVVAVGSADPVGMDRLITGLADVKRIAGETPVQVVVTRVRRACVGRDPEGQITEALSRHAGIDDPVLIPDDRDAYDTCLREGLTLAEAAPRSPARKALAEFARRVAAVTIAT